MTEIVATNVVASRPPNGDRLQRRPLVPIFKIIFKYEVIPKQEIAEDSLKSTKVLPIRLVFYQYLSDVHGCT